MIYDQCVLEASTVCLKVWMFNNTLFIIGLGFILVALGIKISLVIISTVVDLVPFL